MGVEIKNYLPLVRSIAYKIYKKSNRKIDLEDLIGAGNFGLVKAIHTYTTGHGATFNTYASLKVWNTIMDELRYLNWVPRTTIKKENFKYPKIINIDEDI
ncbi:MAG: hypothetical protein KKD77_23035, partial [Gammaproteobacteria bacterium]|nr:hypothetical protein [Gammaproteobacteria bacterium]